jgi:hypothetical protein
MRLRSALLGIRDALDTTPLHQGRRLRSFVQREIEAGLAKPNSRRRRSS